MPPRPNVILQRVDNEAVIATQVYQDPAFIASLAWGKITETPTTLAGYGITDAQEELVSGTNIKTINGDSLLGSGNITVAGSISGLTTGRIPFATSATTIGDDPDMTFTGGNTLNVPQISTGVAVVAGDVVAVNIGAGGVLSPSARLHTAASTGAAGTASLKLNAGVLLVTPENATIENDGTDLYYTTGGVRYKLTKTPA